MNQNKVIGHGYFRKSKAYGLVCGIALGAALLLGGQVSADEVAVQEADPVSTEQVASQTVVVPITEELDTALENAQAAGVTVTQEETVVVADTAAAEADYAAQAEAINTAVAEKAAEVAAYEAALAEREAAVKEKEKQDNAARDNVDFEIEANAKGVDNLEYGNSIMTAATQEDGGFTFSHDMNDGVGIIGHGVLVGKVNHRYEVNYDGSIRAYIDSITLDSYQYTNTKVNQAVNQNIAFRVLTKDGQVVYEHAHNGNSNFTNTINQTVQLGLVYDLASGESTGLIDVIQIHDDWIHDTYGWGSVSYKNNNPVIPVMIVPPMPTPPADATVTYHLNAFQNELVSVKDIVKDGVSIDNGTLKIGETATYTLQAPLILANGQDELVKYEIVDMLDVEHDKYLGYRVYAFVPITLTDGTVLESHADLEAFVQQTYDESTGRFVVSLNSDFLARIAKDSDFQVGVDIDFERIKAGEVFNDFVTNIAFMDAEGNVTEVPVTSNEVKTSTPEDPEEPVSEVPTPIKVDPATPVVQATVLPKTGDETTPVNIIVSLLGVLTFAFGLFGIRKHQEN
ncbi:LPXTG cell wall anchor domain-containing protein [Streptococcus chenjunshii]|uniref:LPXTG cell wall anchor domain-containing protein n=1 Tax=Streptococcus chenjunshii TaxID=2173853 RepID=A0A372KPE2_9STRE|nr:LPXTG cell wall anchor domain-containing protein [Streptococcus chenjunshii]AXQ79731.1 LPXTG cell wall anchor domain-containing protein [Streptococcus chenjunshii]RFU51963.1 LPXTG cell wall anchor domain-containing protein [Streptococcus chenjunshii]RFU54155.1 LPXTG cell wall anchor domain-containing protein [Streptococcus chenjunshii]